MGSTPGGRHRRYEGSDGMFSAPMERAVKSFLKGYFEEFVQGLDTNVDCSKLPATLYRLELKQDRINEIFEEGGSACPFEFTDGIIGSVKLMPSWGGTLEVVLSDVRLNLAFCPIKAMKKAMLPAEDEEDDWQNQVPIDIQMGLAAVLPGGQGGPNGQGQVPPCYCARHDEPRKRQKAEPRDVECRGCRMPLQTNYVDFTLCPHCSQRELRCMCCGVMASSPSRGRDNGIRSQSQPRWMPDEGNGPRGRNGMRSTSQPRWSPEERNLPAPPPRAASPTRARQSEQIPPRYCSAHSTSDKRRKGEPRSCECQGCKQPLSTNYVEFAYCPACSEAEERCMCCGAGVADPSRFPDPPPPAQGRRSSSTGVNRSSFLGCGDDEEGGCGGRRGGARWRGASPSTLAPQKDFPESRRQLPRGAREGLPQRSGEKLPPPPPLPPRR